MEENVSWKGKGLRKRGKTKRKRGGGGKRTRELNVSTIYHTQVVGFLLDSDT